MKKSAILALILFSIQTIMGQNHGVNPKVKEYGIGIYNFNNFSIQYRWGHEKKLNRITGSLGLSNSNNKDNISSSYIQDTNVGNTTSIQNTDIPFNFRVGLNYSILFLKPMNDNFGLFYGPSLGINYNNVIQNHDFNSSFINTSNNTETQTSNNEIKNQLYGTNLGFVIGAFYKLNKSIYIYGEINPNLYINYNKIQSSSNRTITNTSIQTSTTTTQDQNTSRVNYGLNNFSNSNLMLTFAYRITK